MIHILQAQVIQLVSNELNHEAKSSDEEYG